MSKEKQVQAKEEKPETNETKINDTALTKADPVKRIIAFIIDAVASMFRTPDIGSRFHVT
jgi:hypothetical protein